MTTETDKPLALFALVKCPRKKCGKQYDIEAALSYQDEESGEWGGYFSSRRDFCTGCNKPLGEDDVTYEVRPSEKKR